MSDLISRADAIEAVRLETGKLGMGLLGKGDILDIISSLPSADAVSRDVHVGIVNELVKRIEELKADAVQGEWVYIDNYYRVATCSRCHKVTMFEKWGAHTKPYNYCPKCGAKMKGGAV